MNYRSCLGVEEIRKKIIKMCNDIVKMAGLFNNASHTHTHPWGEKITDMLMCVEEDELKTE